MAPPSKAQLRGLHDDVRVEVESLAAALRAREQRIQDTIRAASQIEGAGAGCCIM